jgi:hypothetical protein
MVWVLGLLDTLLGTGTRLGILPDEVGGYLNILGRFDVRLDLHTPVSIERLELGERRRTISATRLSVAGPFFPFF